MATVYSQPHIFPLQLTKGGTAFISQTEKLGHLKGSWNRLFPETPESDLGVWPCATWLLWLRRQCYGSNFSIAGESPWFSLLHSSFSRMCMKSDVELNSRFLSSISNTFHTDYGTSVGYTTQPPYTLWLIRKPLLSAASKSRAWESRVWERVFRAGLGWAGTWCAFRVDRRAPFTTARQGGAAGAEKESRRL